MVHAVQVVAEVQLVQMPGCGHWVHALGETPLFQNIAMEALVRWVQPVQAWTPLWYSQRSQRQVADGVAGAGHVSQLVRFTSRPRPVAQVVHLVLSVALHWVQGPAAEDWQTLMQTPLDSL